MENINGNGLKSGIPVANEKSQTCRACISNEDGNGDGGEDNDRPDHVKGEPQPPRATLEHDAGPRVAVNLVAQIADELGLYPE